MKKIISILFLLLVIPTLLLQISVPVANYFVKNSVITVAGIGFNLFSGRFYIHNLNIKNEQGSTHLEKFDIDLGLAALLSKRVLIEHFKLGTLYSNIRVTPKEISFGLDILLNAQKQDATVNKPYKPNVWKLGVHNVVMEDIRIQAKIKLSETDTFQTNTVVINTLNICQFYQWSDSSVSIYTGCDKSSISLLAEVNDAVLSMNNSEFVLSNPMLNYSIDNLLVSDILAFIPNIPFKVESNVNLKGSLGFNTFFDQFYAEGRLLLPKNSIKSLIPSSDFERIAFDLALDFDIQGDLGSQVMPLSIDTSLFLKNIDVEASKYQAKLALGSFNLDLRAKLWNDGNLYLELTKPFNISLEDVKIDLHPYSSYLKQIQVQGIFNNFKKNISVKDLIANVNGFQVNSTLVNQMYSGDLGSTSNTILSVESLKILAPSVIVGDIGQSLTFNLSKVFVQGLQLMQAKDSLLSFNVFEINDILFKQNKELSNLAINKVVLDDARSHLIMKKEGIPKINRLIASLQPPAFLNDTENDKTSSLNNPDNSEDSSIVEVESNYKENQKSTFNFDIKQLLVRNYHLDFTDAVTSPSDQIHMQWNIKQMKVGRLNSLRPEILSSIFINLEDNSYSEIDIHGSIAPLAKSIVLDLTTTIKGLDLLAYSPYIRRSTEYIIESGELSLGNTLTLKNDYINSDLDLNFMRLKLKKTNNPSPYDNNLPIPLNVALMALKDVDGHIKLKFPIKGKLDSIKTSLNSVFQVAFTKALSLSSVQYLRKLVQPYTFLYDSYQGVKWLKNKIPLFKVEHTYLEETLSVKGRKHLKKLAAMLIEKKEMDVQLCSKATKNEWVSLNNNALPLIKKRTRFIKDALVNEYNVLASRLQLCTEESAEDRALAETVILL